MAHTEPDILSSPLAAPETKSPPDHSDPGGQGAKTHGNEAAKDTSQHGLELVTEGYYKYTDIVFDWSKALHPYHANAVKALINFHSLTHPDHPFHILGKDGATLFLCKEPSGHKRLMFSLKQVQYLQYYIHELQLTKPKIAKQVALALNGGRPIQDEEEDGGEEAAGTDGVDELGIPEWVPLPDALFRVEQFTSVEPINLASASVIKKTLHAIQRENKALVRAQMTMTPSEAARYDAEIDNNTPGPGLRNFGQERKRSSWRRSRENMEDEAEKLKNGIGWGGFPIVQQGVKAGEGNDKVAGEMAMEKENVTPQSITDPTQDPSSDVPDKEPEIVLTTPPVLNTPDIPSLAKEDDAESVGDEDDDNSRQAKALSDVLQLMNATKVEPEKDEVIAEVPVIPTTSKQVSVDDAIEHYHHAQQALILASQGGLVRALANAPQGRQTDRPSEEEEESAAPPDPDSHPLARVGRSLFVSLHVVPWEEDEDVILEVGYSAIWWQPVLNAGKPTGEYEEARDRGHYIIQDHLLAKKNAHWRPNNRDHYNFGSSIPITQTQLESTVKRLLDDLSAKAGGGPTYMVVHSTPPGPGDLSQLGLPVISWYTSLKPSGWEYGSYASHEAIGNTFVIDTALLFGAIESSKSGSGTTTKSLAEVGWIMFGEDKERAPTFTGNAGNDAFYNIEIFLAVVTGPELEVLRADYQESQKAALPPSAPAGHVEEPIAQPSSDAAASVAPQIHSPGAANALAKQQQQQQIPPPLRANNGVLPERNANDGYDEDEEYDEEDAIAGIYYEDDEGKMIKMET